MAGPNEARAAPTKREQISAWVNRAIRRTVVGEATYNKEDEVAQQMPVRYTVFSAQRS